jgi:hypothetical protein
MADEKLQLLHDKQLIRELAERYAHCVDRRKFGDVAGLFTAGGEIVTDNFTMQGHKGIEAGLQQMEKFQLTQHCIHNQLVVFEGTCARAETYCVAHHIYEKKALMRKMDWGIRYLDQLVKSQGDWLFQKRELILDWRQDLPLELK